MDKTVANLNAQLDSVLKPLFQNKVFLASLGLFFALYAGMLAPALPNSVILFFDTIPGKLLFIFLIAFVASRNVPNSLQVALIVSVIFLVSLTVLNNLKMKEAFQTLSREHFGLMGQIHGMTIEGFEDSADARCKKALNQCAMGAKDDIRRQLYKETMHPKGDAVDLPTGENAVYDMTKCEGYARKCMTDVASLADNDRLNFSPELPQPMTKDQCFTKYPLSGDEDLKLCQMTFKNKCKESA